MHKNYTRFNLISLLAIILSVFLLVFLFEDSESVVEFSDSGLEEAVRDTIEKEEGTIYIKDVENIQILDASDRKIENLDGIEFLIELRDLNLEDNFVKNVSPLKNTTKLQKLNLRNNEITSLEEIQFQDVIYLNIRDLSLRHNVKRDKNGKGTRLSDISLLSKMVSLRKLGLRDNHVEDLTPLSDLRKLKKLDIRENKFKTIEPLETLTKLEKLNIRENKIKSLKSIRYLSHLTYLNIHSDTHLESLEPIKELVNIETLIMRNIEIKDASFLKKLTKLQRFNGIDTGIEKADKKIFEDLLAEGALQGEVRPIRMLHTIEAPRLSKESGFYKSALKIEMENKSPDNKIYYTLDGSEPTIKSNIYETPITIKNTDNKSATIVRSKVLTEENAMSETITKTYFVNEDIEERFDLPIFSLVTDPDNLFDEDIGIYADGNYTNRGSDWEKPVHVEFIEKDGTISLSQNAGIRIHGGATRGANQKSLRLYADSKYDDQDFFNYLFFKDLKQQNYPNNINSFKRLILRNSGNDWNQTMFNDAMMQSLVKSIGTVDTQAYQPVIIFVNGEYHGIQNIRERMDEYYLSDHYKIDKDDLVILEKNAELYRGGNKDIYHYTNMMKYIEDNGVKNNKDLHYIETMMDFENFIDYFASEIYFANADWPGNNIMYWRKTTNSYKKDAPYGHDGRWRWMMYDTDFGFYRSDQLWGGQNQPLNHKHNTIRWVMTEFDRERDNHTSPKELFVELMQNQKFKDQFLVRFNDLVNSYLDESVAVSKINEMKSGIEREMPHHIKQWGAIESIEEWENYIDRKHFFAKERPSYIRKYIMEEFDIDNMIDIRVHNETEQGYVQLNTIDINSDLPANDITTIWSGSYFKDVPINIEAIAKEGYEFSHWENLDSTDKSAEITPRNDIEIQAVFKEK